MSGGSEGKPLKALVKECSELLKALKRRFGEELYEKAVSLSPDDFIALNSKALELIMRGEREKAGALIDFLMMHACSRALRFKANPNRARAIEELLKAAKEGTLSYRLYRVHNAFLLLYGKKRLPIRALENVYEPNRFARLFGVSEGMSELLYGIVSGLRFQAKEGTVTQVDYESSSITFLGKNRAQVQLGQMHKIDVSSDGKRVVVQYSDHSARRIAMLMKLLEREGIKAERVEGGLRFELSEGDREALRRAGELLTFTTSVDFYKSVENALYMMIVQGGMGFEEALSAKKRLMSGKRE